MPVSTPQGSISIMTLLNQGIGLFDFFFGVLMIIVGWLGIRKGEIFAWYVLLWFFVVEIAYDGLLKDLSPPALIIDILAGLGLLLSYGKFFPKKQLAAS